nr:unnamed protein product [Callosobruchus analis]
MKENQHLLREIDLLRKRTSDQDYIIALQKASMGNVNPPAVSKNTTLPLPDISYSDAIKRCLQNRKEKESPAIIIKGDTKVNPADISKEIRSKINPANANINIASTKFIKNGFLINCCDAESLQRLKNSLGKEVGNKYSISEATKFNPRVIVRDVEEDSVNEDVFFCGN